MAYLPLLIAEAALLVAAAWGDIATRIIPNRICFALGIVGVASRAFAGPEQLLMSLAVGLVVFVGLFVLYCARAFGGGDVKLLTAISLGLPAVGVLRLFLVTGLAGGVIALVHLVLRLLPRPKASPAGTPVLRRVYAAERWRNLRKAPLPYGVAIACGGIVAALSNLGS